MNENWSSYQIIKWHHFFLSGSPYGLVVNVLYYDILISEFELQLRYYLHFRTSTRKKGMKFLDPPKYVLNSTTTVLIQEFIEYLTKICD